MTKNGHDGAGADRVAMTVRIDRALYDELEIERAALSHELKVSLTRNDFWERMGREYLEARRAGVSAPPVRPARRA